MRLTNVLTATMRFYNIFTATMIFKNIIVTMVLTHTVGELSEFYDTNCRLCTYTVGLQARQSVEVCLLTRGNYEMYNKQVTF